MRYAERSTPGGSVGALALDAQRHRQARLLDLRDQPVEVLQPGLRRQRRGLVFAASA